MLTGNEPCVDTGIRFDVVLPQIKPCLLYLLTIEGSYWPKDLIEDLSLRKHLNSRPPRLGIWKMVRYWLRCCILVSYVHQHESYFDNHGRLSKRGGIDMSMEMQRVR